MNTISISEAMLLTFFAILVFSITLKCQTELGKWLKSLEEE